MIGALPPDFFYYEVQIFAAPLAPMPARDKRCLTDDTRHLAAHLVVIAVSPVCSEDTNRMIRRLAIQFRQPENRLYLFAHKSIWMPRIDQYLADPAQPALQRQNKRVMMIL